MSGIRKLTNTRERGAPDFGYVIVRKMGGKAVSHSRRFLTRQGAANQVKLWKKSAPAGVSFAIRKGTFSDR